MADKQYVYAVARIRSKELSLLSGAFLEQLHKLLKSLTNTLKLNPSTISISISMAAI